MLTFWCIVVVVLTPLAVGVPARWIVGGCRPLDGRAWLEAPFVGLAAAILPLQTLYYLDITVGSSAPGLWVVVLLGWGAMVWHGHLLPTLKDCPWPVFAACLLVYLVQGAGLVKLGVENYIGRGWLDSINYISIADAVHSLPHSTEEAEIGQRYYLIPALVLKNDRLGQSVLHALLMATTGCTAKMLFGPLIILGVSLVVIPMFGILCRLGCSGRLALGAGVTAALLPALTLLQLECFLSHAEALAGLLMLPVVLADLCAERGWTRCLVASLVAALVGSIYTELFPLIAILGAGFLVLSWVSPYRSWLLTGHLLLVILAPAWLNPLFAPRVHPIFLRLGSDIPGVYPWALQAEGFGRVWFGDLVLTRAGEPVSFLHLLGVALSLLATIGLVIALLRRQLQPASVIMLLSLLGLVLVPILSWSMPNRSYQFYKLFCTITPILFVGLVLLAAHSRRVWLLVGVVAVLAPIATVRMALEAGGPSHQNARAWQQHLLSPEAIELAAVLDHMDRQSLVFNDLSFTPSVRGYLNSWFAYHARQNQVWSTETKWQGQELNGHYRSLFDTTRLPQDFLILSRADGLPCDPEEVSYQMIVWKGGPYRLWKPRPRQWILLTQIDNPNTVESHLGKAFCWLGGGETCLHFLAAREGIARLTLELEPGPSLAGSEVRRLLLRTDRGSEQRLILGRQSMVVHMNVRPGVNQLFLKPLDLPTPGLVLPNGDTRPLLLKVSSLRLRLEPEDARAKK